MTMPNSNSFVSCAILMLRPLPGFAAIELELECEMKHRLPRARQELAGASRKQKHIHLTMELWIMSSRKLIKIF